MLNSVGEQVAQYLRQPHSIQVDTAIGKCLRVSEKEAKQDENRNIHTNLFL